MGRKERGWEMGEWGDGEMGKWGNGDWGLAGGIVVCPASL